MQYHIFSILTDKNYEIAEKLHSQDSDKRGGHDELVY